MEEYFNQLKEKEVKNSLHLDEKKELQLLKDWQVVEPILKLEQEKREELKEL